MPMTPEQRARYREIAVAYRLAHGPAPFEVKNVIAWANDPKNGQALPRLMADMIHGEYMSESLRSITVKDGSNRKVRLWHCVAHSLPMENSKSTQRYLWAEEKDASPEHLRMSLVQGREKIVADCKALKAKEDRINAILAKKGRELVQLDFNFTGDINPPAAEAG